MQLKTTILNSRFAASFRKIIRLSIFWPLSISMKYEEQRITVQ